MDFFNEMMGNINGVMGQAGGVIGSVTGIIGTIGSLFNGLGGGTGGGQVNNSPPVTYRQPEASGGFPMGAAVLALVAVAVLRK